MKSALLTSSAILVLGLAAVCEPTAAEAASFKVFPGDSIQAAVDAASAGDKVIVYPGTYIEPHTGPAVRITKPLKLIGKSKGVDKVILLAGAGQTHGVLVEPANPGDPEIEGFQIKGMTVEGFPGNGIYLRYVNGFKIDKNESKNNLENGIFPTLSANGLVKRNLSYGAEDTALWVEASENVRVLKNELHSAPTALEVTVSNNLEIKGNIVHDATVGIGIYHPETASLPPLAEMLNIEVSKNHVYNNNAPNTAPPGSMSASLPAGGGILILGADGVIATDNTIEDNSFYGVAMVDYCLAVAGSAFNCDDFPPDIESYPDGNIVDKNVFINNGTAPQGTCSGSGDLCLVDGDCPISETCEAHPLAPYAADITYILFDPALGNQNHGNCFSRNEFSTSQKIGDQPIFLLAGAGSCL